MDGSGLPRTPRTRFVKVGECLYRLGGSDGTNYAIVKHSGKQFRRSLDTKDRKLAERRLAVLREKVARMPASTLSAVATFSDLANRWLEAVRQAYKPSSAKRREVCIRQLRPFFDAVPLTNTTFTTCEQWLKQRGNDLSDSSYNQEREALCLVHRLQEELRVMRALPAKGRW